MNVPSDVITAAQAAQWKWGIPASVTLAQWALESAWGTKMPVGEDAHGRPIWSNNPFGIKARSGEPYVESKTREVINGKSDEIDQRFREFPSIAAAFDYHGELLATGLPYRHAMTLVRNPEAFAHALTGVYATDPHYGDTLVSIMREHNLTQYDTVRLAPVYVQDIGETDVDV